MIKSIKYAFKTEYYDYNHNKSFIDTKFNSKSITENIHVNCLKKVK